MCANLCLTIDFDNYIYLITIYVMSFVSFGISMLLNKERIYWKSRQIQFIHRANVAVLDIIFLVLLYLNKKICNIRLFPQLLLGIYFLVFTNSDVSILYAWVTWDKNLIEILNFFNEYFILFIELKIMDFLSL
jgi:hypothetical protein